MEFYGIEVILSPYSGEWGGPDGRWNVDLDLGPLPPEPSDWNEGEDQDPLMEPYIQALQERHLGRITEYSEEYSESWAAYPPEGYDGFSYGRAWCKSKEEAVQFLILEHLMKKLDMKWEDR